MLLGIHCDSLSGFLFFEGVGRVFNFSRNRRIFYGNLVTGTLGFNRAGMVVVSVSAPSVSLIGSNVTNNKNPLERESNPVIFSGDGIRLSLPRATTLCVCQYSKINRH